MYNLFIFFVISNSFKNSSGNFNRDILRLAFLLFLVVQNTVGSGAGLGATSNASSGVGVLCGFFTGIFLLLKLSRTFSLVLINNSTFFKEDVLRDGLLPFAFTCFFKLFLEENM